MPNNSQQSADPSNPKILETINENVDEKVDENIKKIDNPSKNQGPLMTYPIRSRNDPLVSDSGISRFFEALSSINSSELRKSLTCSALFSGIFCMILASFKELGEVIQRDIHGNRTQTNNNSNSGTPAPDNGLVMSESFKNTLSQFGSAFLTITIAGQLAYVAKRTLERMRLNNQVGNDNGVAVASDFVFATPGNPNLTTTPTEPSSTVVSPDALLIQVERGGQESPRKTN